MELSEYVRLCHCKLSHLYKL